MGAIRIADSNLPISREGFLLNSGHKHWVSNIVFICAQLHRDFLKTRYELIYKMIERVDGSSGS